MHFADQDGREVVCLSKAQVKRWDRVRNPCTWALTACASICNPGLAGEGRRREWA